MGRQFAKCTGILGVAVVFLLTVAFFDYATAREVGVTSAANPSVYGTPPTAEKRTLYLGTDIFFDERIQTSDKGIAQILLLDQSAFTVGPNSDIVIDEFVYDPDTSNGRLITSISKGVLRFVGGKLSKQEKGVTIETPLVVIGVRGGIITWEKIPETGEEEFSFLFGDAAEIFHKSSGKRYRMTEAGNSMRFDPDGAVSGPDRLDQKSIKKIEDALSGDQGTDGGATEQPTDISVATTEIVQLGSAMPPDAPVLAAVVRPQSSGDQDPRNIDSTESLEDATGIDDGLNDQLQEEVGKEIAAEPDPAGEPDPTPDPEPGLLTGSGRYLASGESYTLSWGPVIANPGSVGLLGGSADTDQAITGIEISGNRLLLTLTSGGVVDLPYRVGVFDVLDATTPDGAASGTGFIADTEDFFFYQLTLDSDPDGYIVLLGGEPFDPGTNPADGELNMYTIHPDAVQGLDVPFVQSQLLPDTTGMVTTPLYVLEQTSGTIGTSPGGEATVMLYAALQIEGQGAGQKSAVVLLINDAWFNAETGKLEISGGLRGSVRQSALQGLATFSGGYVATADGNGNAIFGENGEYFVWGHDAAAGDALSVSYADGAPEGVSRRYGVQHPVTYDSSVDRSVLQRGDRNLQMYSAGLAESETWRGEAPMVFRTINGDPTSSPLVLDSATNRLSAMIQVEDALGSSYIEEYQLGFGRFPEGFGASAYIDDETYAARHNKFVTKVFADGGIELSLLDSNPYTYFLTNTLVPVDGFLPEGVTFCTCAFMEWGYWGGRLYHQDPEGAPGDGRSDYFHLETWVAGELPDLLDIPASGVASYSGHAIGDISRISGVDTLNYIAVGNFDMTWDFSARLGTATISDFDGMTFGSEIDGIASLNSREFSGPIGNADLIGELQGSFFSDGIDPVAGVGGDFYVTGADVTAAGTFMGEQ